MLGADGLVPFAILLALYLSALLGLIILGLLLVVFGGMRLFKGKKKGGMMALSGILLVTLTVLGHLNIGKIIGPKEKNYSFTVNLTNPRNLSWLPPNVHINEEYDGFRWIGVSGNIQLNIRLSDEKEVSATANEFHADLNESGEIYKASFSYKSNPTNEECLKLFQNARLLFGADAIRKFGDDGSKLELWLHAPTQGEFRYAVSYELPDYRICYSYYGPLLKNIWWNPNTWGSDKRLVSCDIELKGKELRLWQENKKK